MRKNIKIPWQGVVLGLINVVILLLMIATVVFGSSAFLQAFIMSQNQNIAASYLGIFSGAMITSYLVVIMETLFILGYFYGKKIVVILGLLFVVVELLLGVVTIFTQPQIMLYTIGGLIFPGLVAWMSFACLKHPFYGGGGKIDLETFKFWKKRKVISNDDMATF